MSAATEMNLDKLWHYQEAIKSLPKNEKYSNKKDNFYTENSTSFGKFSEKNALAYHLLLNEGIVKPIFFF